MKFAATADLHFHAEPDHPRSVLAREHLIGCAEVAETVLILGDVTDDGSAEAWARFEEAREAAPLPARIVAWPGNHDYSRIGCGPLDDAQIDRAVAHCDVADSFEAVLWLDLFDSEFPTSAGRYDGRHSMQLECYASIVASHYNPLRTDRYVLGQLDPLHLHGGDRLLRDADAAEAWLVLGGHAGGKVEIVTRGSLTIGLCDEAPVEHACLLVDTDARRVERVVLP